MPALSVDPKPVVFINYSRKDRELAERMRDQLVVVERFAEVELFIDSDIKLGEARYDKLFAKISRRFREDEGRPGRGAAGQQPLPGVRLLHERGGALPAGARGAGGAGAAAGAGPALPGSWCPGSRACSTPTPTRP